MTPPLLSPPHVRLRRALACVCLAAALLSGCAQTVDKLAKEQDAVPGNETAPKSEEDLKTQCWMAQENKKNVNDIDAKIAAVDKCIADGKKHLPPAR
jgi:hypothetical protein